MILEFKREHNLDDFSEGLHLGNSSSECVWVYFEGKLFSQLHHGGILRFKSWKKIL